MADHVVDYLEAKRETLYKVNDQRGERCHQIIAQLEKRGGWRMKRNLTGALKLKRTHSFHSHFNLIQKHKRMQKLKYNLKK